MIIALGGETGLYYCLAVFAMCDSSDERGNSVRAVCGNDDGKLRVSLVYASGLNLFCHVLRKTAYVSGGGYVVSVTRALAAADRKKRRRSINLGTQFK